MGVRVGVRVGVGGVMAGDRVGSHGYLVTEALELHHLRLHPYTHSAQVPLLLR